MTDHPITPPPELVRQWLLEYYGSDLGEMGPDEMYLARYGAQWGADQELEACVKLLELSDKNARDFLYSARRPKPPSLKEQALKELDAWTEERNGPGESLLCDGLSVAIIRRALEQLDG